MTRHSLQQPAIILIRPQMGENIGAAARAMWNFGLDHMRIVDPRDGWPSQKAVAMASGAGRLLDEARLFDTTAEALADTTFVMATTARPRDLTKPVYSPEFAMAEAARRIGTGQKVAVMFGPERAGLENDDIIRANAIISVPVNPDFPSLNLAQCVLLLSYEWQRQLGEVGQPAAQVTKSEWASGLEVEKLAEHFEQRLDTAGFFFPETKAASMKVHLRNLWSRMPLTKADTTFVMATTARPRDLTKPVYSPEFAMAEAARRIGTGQKVAVMFGPERAGLENDDIIRANAIISVPVNPDFPSLNLAQCVLLLSYEWQRQVGEVGQPAAQVTKSEWASGLEVEKLAEHFEQRLDTAGFFFPETKAASMKVHLRNLWSRMPLTKADVQMLHGTMRQMVRWKERG